MSDNETPPPATPELRQNKDRRKRTIPVAVERRSGKDRRLEKGERRRQVDPTTCEKEYSDEEIGFMRAMDHYKRANRRPFPTWSEVLEVLHSRGYRRVAETTVLPGLPVKPAKNSDESGSAAAESASDEHKNRRHHDDDRRKRTVRVAVERRSGHDRRYPPPPPPGEEEAELAFMTAMDQYKRSNRRPFPTWSEVLEVVLSLGYRLVAEPTALPGLPVQPAAVSE